VLHKSYLVDREDLTRGLLKLVSLLEDVPETRLGSNFIGAEDTHAEDRRVGVVLGRLLATNDLVLVQEGRLDVATQRSKNLLVGGKLVGRGRGRDGDICRLHALYLVTNERVIITCCN
jgi:hypothetical protein